MTGENFVKWKVSYLGRTGISAEDDFYLQRVITASVSELSDTRMQADVNDP